MPRVSDSVWPCCAVPEIWGEEVCVGTGVGGSVITRVGAAVAGAEIEAASNSPKSMRIGEDLKMRPV